MSKFLSSFGWHCLSLRPNGFALRLSHVYGPTAFSSSSPVAQCILALDPL